MKRRKEDTIMQSSEKNVDEQGRVIRPGERPIRPVNDIQNDIQGENLGQNFPGNIPLEPSPVDGDSPGAYAAGNVADSLEYADLEADADDNAPLTSDISSEEAVQRVRNARPRRR